MEEDKGGREGDKERMKNMKKDKKGRERKLKDGKTTIEGKKQQREGGGKEWARSCKRRRLEK